MEPRFPTGKHCLDRNGREKRAWFTAKAARRAARYTERNPVTNSDRSLPLRAYRCPSCDLYHIGHSTAGRQRKPEGGTSAWSW